MLLTLCSSTDNSTQFCRFPCVVPRAKLNTPRMRVAEVPRNLPNGWLSQDVLALIQACQTVVLLWRTNTVFVVVAVPTLNSGMDVLREQWPYPYLKRLITNLG